MVVGVVTLDGLRFRMGRNKVLLDYLPGRGKERISFILGALL